MHFNQYFFVGFITLAGFACSPYDGYNSSDSPAKTEILPTFYANASSGAMIEGDRMTVLDREVKLIHEFSVSEFTRKTTVTVPFLSDQQWFLTGKNAAYYVIVGKTDYAINGIAGVEVKNPVQLTENIAGVAFSPSKGKLIVADEFLSMAVVSLNDAGVVTGTYKGGPNVGTDTAVSAGAIMNDGRFVVSQGDDKISIIDLDATIRDQAWRIQRTFTLSKAKGISWLSPVNGFDHLILVKDSSRIMLVDVNAQTISGIEVDVSGKEVTYSFRDAVPHFITSDVSAREVHPVQLVYVDSAGALQTRTLRAPGTRIRRSWLSPDSGRLNLMYLDSGSSSDNTYAASTVYRYRYADGVLLDKSEIKESVQVGMSNEYLFLRYDSPLGKMERRTYGSDPVRDTVSAYNLPFLQDNYRRR